MNKGDTRLFAKTLRCDFILTYLFGKCILPYRIVAATSVFGSGNAYTSSSFRNYLTKLVSILPSLFVTQCHLCITCTLVFFF